MKISYNWLKEYVDVTASPTDLADMLTMAGLEVESVDRVGVVPQGVVVGHVSSVEKHPDADRLTVCSVDVGEEEPLQIVCGAPNVAAGQKVAVAPVGTRLTMPAEGTGREITLKVSKIRGVESHGMICAEDELGLSDDHSGIVVLHPDSEAGQSLSDSLKRTTGRVEDAVIDIAVTPNRPDATSHIGVARDVAAITDRPLRLPEVDVPAPGGEAGEQIAVRIASPELCHRYVAVVVRDVRIGESPAWLRNRLEAVGLRPRNSVVDITNYVMYEVGQPLHAFDLDNLAGSRIEVRATDRVGRFTTLDDKERELPAGTLMIRDGERDVAIAGVMGGQNSEVSEQTMNVLIESAYFDPSTVRRTAKAMGLQTDASYRFERGVDPGVQAWAALRAAGLMSELAGGTIVEALVDENPRPHVARQIEVRMSRVDHVLGTHVPRARSVKQLEAIGLSIDSTGDDRILCTIPLHRPDIEREVDVIEEVARLYGYDRIEEPRRSSVPSFVPRSRKPDVARDLLFSRLTGWGYREVFTNSLLPRNVAEAFFDEAVAGDLHAGDVVTTANAITQDMTTLRPSLLPGLLQVARHNANHGQKDIRLVEIGHVFSRQREADTLIPGFEEHEVLSLLLTGQEGERHWAREPRSFDVHDLLGTVDALVDLLDIDGVSRRPRTEPSTVVEHGITYYADGARIGFAGRLADTIARNYDLTEPVLFAEMDWGRLVDTMSSVAEKAYAPVSRYPVVERDLAFVVSTSQDAGPMLDLIRTAGGPLLQEAGVFDIYRGDRIESGKKSLAFFLRFGANRTLTDQEVDARVEEVVGAVVREFGADLRE